MRKQKSGEQHPGDEDGPVRGKEAGKTIDPRMGTRWKAGRARLQTADGKGSKAARRVKKLQEASVAKSEKLPNGRTAVTRKEKPNERRSRSGKPGVVTDRSRGTATSRAAIRQADYTTDQVAVSPRRKPNRHMRKRALKEAFSFLVEADRRTPNQVRVGLAARRAEIERSKGTSSTATLDTVQNRASARKFPGAIVPGLGRTGLSTDQGPDLNQVSGTKNPDLKAELVARRRAYLVASTPKKGKLPK